VRPVCYQNAPESLLPAALQNNNPLGLWRTVNGVWTQEPIQIEILPEITANG
jgi:NADP-dependent aldehyde dehydrogenase